MKTKYFLFFALFMSAKGFAQTTTTITITYSNAFSNCNLSTLTCNVFCETPTVEGYTHYAVAGGCGFTGTYIIMPTLPHNSSNNTYNGTAYAIKDTFIAGYTYNITTYAKDSANPSSESPKLTLSLSNGSPAPVSPGICGAVFRLCWCFSAATPTKNNIFKRFFVI